MRASKRRSSTDSVVGTKQGGKYCPLHGTCVIKEVLKYYAVCLLASRSRQNCLYYFVNNQYHHQLVIFVFY